MNYKNLSPLLFFLLLLMSCSTPDPDKNYLDATCNGTIPLAPLNLKGQLQATTDFGFDLFQKSTELEPGNTIQSPVSIYSALLMLYEGADCATKAQISQALTLGMANTFPVTSENYSRYLDSWNDDSEAFSLKIANALFSDPNRVNLIGAYQNKLNSTYRAELEELDFSNPATALEKINQWASDNTEGKIEKVLDEINAEDVAFLMNALYFKSDWEIGFPPERTKEADFTKKDGTVISVPLMNRHELTLSHRGEILDLVELPLRGNKYVVNLFLPADESVSIDQIIQMENFQETFINAVESCQNQNLIVNLPKFELKGKQDLETALKELGLIDAFSESDADLSPMGTGIDGKLFVSKALHDTYIKLDEKGIEGAAVTSISIGVTSLPPSIDFDRPFAFVIRKSDSYAPLFIGKVENPLE